MIGEIRKHGEAGFTYQPVSKDSPKEGWVSGTEKGTGRLVEHASGVPEKKLVAELEEFARSRWSQFQKDPQAHIGGWYDKSDDTLHYDVSEVTGQDKKAQCVAFAVTKSQRAIFSLKDMETYDLTEGDYKQYGGDRWQTLLANRP